ncbi:MAG: hypothetical protein QF381_00075 [Nitrososphaerales archaeon]|jgi:hypothetical protein|nr:hypothetical protein [Nitrososphaerales archaeon]|tara:strand:- start:9430 stop:10746 length:1317 start_codon:yes stop_codon:yes gene_type:complete
MKKVLIITNLAHAEPRIPGLMKYLPDFGWNTTVLTTSEYNTHLFDDDNVRLDKKNRIIIVRYFDILNHLIMMIKKIFGYIPEESLKRQADIRFGLNSPKTNIINHPLNWFKEVLYYPDQDKFWKKSAIITGFKLIRNQQINMIMSSSSPVTSHIIAKELKKRCGIPWIADLRDLWSQNHNYPYSSFRNSIDRKLEVKTLSNADALVTVSKPLVNQLKKIHPNKTVLEITNGFHLDEMKKDCNLTSKFTITYTGQIYFGKQDPTNLFAPLKELILEGDIDQNDVQVRFYGYFDARLTKVIREYLLTDVVKQYGVVSREVAQQKQRESQLLLFLNWEDKREKGIYQTKIFEYLAANRPIFAVGGFGNDVIERLLNETKAGIYAQKEDIKITLKKIYNEYKQKKEVRCHVRPESINRYSYQENAKTLAKNFDKILANRKHQ